MSDPKSSYPIWEEVFKAMDKLALAEAMSHFVRNEDGTLTYKPRRKVKIMGDECLSCGMSREQRLAYQDGCPMRFPEHGCPFFDRKPMSESPRTDAVALDEREGIMHPELCETYMAWTDYWALRELARQLERELAAAKESAEQWHRIADLRSKEIIRLNDELSKAK